MEYSNGECLCVKGYQLDDIKKNCIKVCGKNMILLNKTCVCYDGYTLTETGKNCKKQVKCG